MARLLTLPFSTTPVRHESYEKYSSSKRRELTSYAVVKLNEKEYNEINFNIHESWQVIYGGGQNSLPKFDKQRTKYTGAYDSVLRTNIIKSQ